MNSVKDSTNQKFLELPADKEQIIDQEIPGWGGQPHQFDIEQVGALQAAWFSSRPLLVRGDPGLGKSQMAPAIASYLGFRFINITINGSTEIEDLLYNVDHIKRLSLLENKKVDLESAIEQGVLWRALAPTTTPSDLKASAKENQHIVNGTVLLIDEIDKADASLPNALLEVLNNQTITVNPLNKVLTTQVDNPVVVIITSYEERELPEAFLRRCAVLDLTLSNDDTGIEKLVSIFKVHQKNINNNAPSPIDIATAEGIAGKVIKTRKLHLEKQEYLPGTSEFLDYLRAFSQLPSSQSDMAERLKQYIIEKRNLREISK